MSTVRAVNVPSEVMFVCAAVESVPSNAETTSVPAVIVRLPVDAPVAVVVPIVNLSALSSHAIIALSPVEPRSITIPKSFELLPAPLLSSMRLSPIIVLEVATVVVVPLTVRFPVTVRFCEAVTLPEESMARESVSPTEPMLPALGIIIFPPVVINPAPVYVPLTSKLAFTSTRVAFNSISSVAAISNTVALAP